MKTHQPIQPSTLCPRPTLALLASLLALLTAPSAWAATTYWNGAGSLWSSTAAWSTVFTATTPNPSVVPNANSNVLFNVNSANAAAQTVYLNGNQASAGITFSNTAGTTLLGGVSGTPAINTLTLGSNITASAATIITVSALATNVTIGDVTAGGANVTNLLGGATNNVINIASGRTLTIANGINYNTNKIQQSTAGGDLILNGAGTGAGTVSVIGGVNYNVVARLDASTITDLGNAKAFGSGDVDWRNTLRANTALTGANKILNRFVLPVSGQIIGGSANIEFGGAIIQNATATVTITNLGTTTISGPIYLSDAVATARTLTISVPSTAGATTISGLIANYTTAGSGASSALVLPGTGTVNISGANNTFSGGTTVGANGGSTICNVTASGALGTNTIFMPGNGGTCCLYLSGGINLTNPISVNGKGTSPQPPSVLNVSGNNTIYGAVTVNSGGIASAIESDSGTLTISNAVALTSSASGTRVVTFRGAGNIVMNGVIQNGSATTGLIIEKNDSGTLTLKGANTFSGGTLVSGGTLQLGLANALPCGAGVASVTNNATLDLNTFSAIVNGLAGSGTVDTVAGGTPTLTIGSNNVTSAFGGVIQNTAGTLSLAKVGSGIVTLSGANSYSGTTVVAQGKLIVSSAQTGTGIITVSNGVALGVTVSGASQLAPTTLKLGTSASATLEFNSISSTSIAPLNPGSVTAGGTVTVNVNSGTVAVGTSYPLMNNVGSAVFSLRNQPAGYLGNLSVSGGTLYYNVTAQADNWTGADGTNPTFWNITNSVNWGGNALLNSPVGTYTNGDTVLFDDTSAQGTVVVAVPVVPANVVVNNNSTPYSITSAGANKIGGSGSLTKAGAATLTLVGGVNNFTGGTIISGGTVSVGALANGGSASDIGASAKDAANLVLDSGTLQYTTADAPSIDRGATIGVGGGTFDINNAGGSVTLGGAIAGTTGGSLTKVGNGALTLTGTNSNNGVTTVSAGTLTLSGASTSSGGTVLSAGQLNINYGGSSSANSAIGTGPLTINGGMIDNTSAADVTVLPSISQNWNANITYAGTVHNLNLGNGAVLIPSSIIRVVTVTNTLTVGGVINGVNAGINKAGSGTLVLTGVNTFNSGITFNTANCGTVVMGGSNALGVAGSVITFATGATGATVDIATDGSNDALYTETSNSGTTWTIASDREAASLPGVNHTMGGFSLGGAGMIFNVVAGPNVSGGSPRLTIGAAALNGGSGGATIINPTTANITIASANNAASSTKTLQLDGTSGDNQITGLIGNTTGALTLTKTNTGTWTLFGTNTFTGGVNIGQGLLVASGPSALGASGTIAFTGGLLRYGTGVNDNYSARFSTAASQPFNIDVNGNSVAYASALISSGGTLDLYDTAGGGTLTLGSTNNYTGATTVHAGKLMFSTAGAGASAVTVNTGAAAGVVLAAAGGSWTNVADLTQSTGTELDVDFATFVPSTTLAPMTINGNFNTTATTTIRVKGLTANFTVGQTYPLVTWVTSGPANTNNFTLIMPTRLAGHLLVSGNTLRVVVDANTGPLSWNAGNGNWNISTPNWVDATLASATYIDGSDGVLFDSASGATGNPIVTLATALSPTSVTINSASHNYTLTGAGGITGSGLMQVQNGTLTNATVNSFTGGTTVTGGKLQISGSGTLGAASSALTVSGGTVDLNGSSLNAGAVTISSGSLQNGTLTNASFTVNNASAMALQVTLAGSGGLTKTGNGTLTMTNQNAFTGSVFVKSGTLVMDSGSAINDGGSYSSIGQNGSDVGTLTLKNNATFTNTSDFNLGDLDSSTGSLNVQDSAVLNVNAFFIGSANATGSTASGTVNQTGGTIIENNAGVGTFAIGGRTSASGGGVYNMSGGTLTAAAGIRVGGTGTGTMNISGTAVVNANGGFNTARITGSTGTLNLNGGTVNTFNFASSTGVNATNNFNGTTVSPTTANAAFMTGLTEANVRNGGAIFDTAGYNITIAQVLQHSDITGDSVVDGGLTKNGGGTLTLNGANTYTGNTTVNGGTLEIASAVIATNSTVTVSGGGAVLQLDFTGVTNQVGALVLNGISQAAGTYNNNNVPAYITGGGSLLVQAVGPSGPAHLTNSVSGSTLSLTWPSGQGWRLVSQTNTVATGIITNSSAWHTVPGVSDGSATLTVDPTKPTVFYELIYP